jgi:putative glutamine amidotransferase
VSTPLSKRPVVVIAGTADGERRGCFLADDYSEAVLRAGGLPLIRPPGVNSPALVDELLARADALIVPGGRDLDTERLGLGPVHPKARLTPTALQDADVAIVTAALRRDMPVLGICYGMQLLGLLGGGTLCQHLEDDTGGHIGPDGTVQHDVQVTPGTRTAAAVGTGLRVWSAHHQALDSAGPGWLVTARDPAGLIEAIEHPGHRLAIGVQWHPERAEPPQDGLFGALVSAATPAPLPG